MINMGHVRLLSFAGGSGAFLSQPVPEPSFLPVIDHCGHYQHGFMNELLHDTLPVVGITLPFSSRVLVLVQRWMNCLPRTWHLNLNKSLENFGFF
jgi:hypothetical protein